MLPFHCPLDIKMTNKGCYSLLSVSSLKYLVAISYSQHISIWTSRISNATCGWRLPFWTLHCQSKLRLFL